MIPIISTIFNKIWGYVLVAGAVVAAVGAIFLGGKISGQKTEQLNNIKEKLDQEKTVNSKVNDMNKAANKAPKTEEDLLNKLKDGGF